jgi:acetyl-CoA carboxylase biotin carboxyl carrier protein
LAQRVQSVDLVTKKPVDPFSARPVASALRNPNHYLTTLDLKEIKELIALMRKNDLSVFKLEQEGFKVTLKRGSDPIITTAPVAAPMALPVAAVPQVAAQAGGGPPSSGSAPATGEKLKEITSPMVGTFYASPTPDAQPFVKNGQEIQPDTVVCIIEAMKVMNEIKAECAGTLVEMVAENGKPVQFGQALFRVRPK